MASQIIHCAIEVHTTATALSDSATGLINGCFQWVSDRPGYDGSTKIPTYGPDEIDTLGNVISGNNVPGAWKQGYLQKEFIDSNPVRSIDMTATGGYSTDSQFSFKIRNDAKFWDYCQSQNINLTGAKVILWNVINDVFYQAARGIVVNNPIDEVDYHFEVDDDATLIHKLMPPLVATATNLPTNPGAAGTAVPVVFGDVQYSPLLKLSTDQNLQQISELGNTAAAFAYGSMGISVKPSLYPDIVTLISENNLYTGGNPGQKFTSIDGSDTTDNYLTGIKGSALVAGDQFIVLIPPPYVNYETPPVIVPAANNNISNTLFLPGDSTANANVALQLIWSPNTVTPNPGIKAGSLIGKYLQVSSGGTSLKPDTKKIYKIIGNSDTYLETHTANHVYVTTVYLDTPLAYDDGSLVGNVTVATATTGIAYDVQHFNSSINTWWFQVIDFSVQVNLSNNKIIGISGLFTFDSNLKVYTDVGSFISSPDTSAVQFLNLIASVATNKGEVTVYEPISLNGLIITPDEFGMILMGTHGGDRISVKNDIASLAKITDRSRLTTPITFNLTTWSDDDIELYLTYRNANKSLDYDGYYLAADFELIARQTGEGQPYLNNPSLRAVFCYVFDAYNKINTAFDYYFLNALYGTPKSDSTIENNFTSTLLKGQTCFIINLIPNSYYQSKNISQSNVNPASYSMFGLQLGAITTNQFLIIGKAGTYSGSTAPQIAVPDFINNPLVNEIQLRLKLNLGAGTVPYTAGSESAQMILSLNQLCLMGSKSVDTLDSDLFANISGESIANDGVTETNSVYTAFRHILEDYDNIPAALIDYGTGSGSMATYRAATGQVFGNWWLGRTLTEQKSALDYLTELAEQSFCFLFTSRNGKVALRAFQPDSQPSPITIHDKNIIVTGSIDSFTKSDITQLYNSFNLQYNYDIGQNKYLNNLNVSQIDNVAGFSTFPLATDLESVVCAVQPSTVSIVAIGQQVSFLVDTGLSLLVGLSPATTVLIADIATPANNMTAGSLSYNATTGLLSGTVTASNGSGGPYTCLVTLQGLPKWYQCVNGLPDSAYAQAADIWNACRAGYLATNANKPAQISTTTLEWFNNANLSTAGIAGTVNDSAYLLLKLFALWSTVPKDIISYAVPINSNTIPLELFDYITVVDSIYTVGTNAPTGRNGYIISKEVDIANDQFKLQVMLDFFYPGNIIIDTAESSTVIIDTAESSTVKIDTN